MRCQTDVLLILPSSQGLAVNESNVCGRMRGWKRGVMTAAAAAHHLSYPHINTYTHTLSTIHVVAPHSTDYKASAPSAGVPVTVPPSRRVTSQRRRLWRKLRKRLPLEGPLIDQ